MQTDRSTLMAFTRSMRKQNEHPSEAEVIATPAVPRVALVARPMQNDRTSLRAAMDRMAKATNS